MNPLKYAQMMKYLTRAKKEKPDLPDVFPASKAPIPAKTKTVEEMEAVNQFMLRNPRVEKAGGGMLVQPGFGGTRQGYAAPLNLERNIEQIKKTQNPELKNKFGFRTMYDIPEGTPGYLGKAGERAVFNTKADAERFVKEDLPKIVSPSRTDETKIAQIKKLFEEGKTNQQVATALKTNITTVKRIKKDLGLDVVKKKQTKTLKQKYLQLKNLAEKANEGFKYVQMKDLTGEVGLATRRSKSQKMAFKKYGIPKLDSAEDKVKKAFMFLTADPNKPVEELFSFNSQIANLTGTNQQQVGVLLGELPEYQDFKPVMNKLNIAASRARITGKSMVLGDLIEEVENVRPTGDSNILRSARNTPEYFIMENAKRHVKQGGTKVEFTRMPGDLDETGKLISTTDAEFIYKGKKYTYDDLLRTGRKNFPEVYKVFDDLDELLNKPVIHPLTKQKINFSTLMKEAYNKGAGYSYDRIPYAIDHFKEVKNEPFTDLRITSARLNSSAGVLKQKGFEAKQGAYGPEKTKLYEPDKVEKYLKKMGYNFTKDINQLFNDEVNLANNILVKKRVLKKPIQISQEYELLQKTGTENIEISGVDKKILNNIQSYSKLSECKIGKAEGGRIGFANSITCIQDGLKEQKLAAQQGNKKAAKELVQVGKVATRAGLLKNLLGPGAILGEAVIEGAIIGNKVLGGKPSDIAYAESYLSYLDPRKYRGELDPLKMRREDMLESTADKNILRSGFAAQDQISDFNKAIEERDRAKKAGRLDEYNPAAADAREQGRLVDQSADIISSEAFKDATNVAQEYLQGQAGKQMADFGIFSVPQSAQADEGRRVRAMTEMKSLYPQYSDKDILNILKEYDMDPKDYDYTYTPRNFPADTSSKPLTGFDDIRNFYQRNQATQNIADAGGVANLAGGGIAKMAGVSSGVAPVKGPNSQGLLSLKNRVRNY